MRSPFTLGLALMFLVMPEVQGQSKPPSQSWRACTQCHQPPDLQFATDQAWLDQVHRTGFCGSGAGASGQRAPRGAGDPARPRSIRPRSRRLFADWRAAFEEPARLRVKAYRGRRGARP